MSRKIHKSATRELQIVESDAFQRGSEAMKRAVIEYLESNGFKDAAEAVRTAKVKEGKTE